MSSTEPQSKGNDDSAVPLTPNITQVSRPYFAAAEIKHFHSQTIAESRKIPYTQKKHQAFQLLFEICKQLKFPLRVLATTMNYYQRYWLFNKFDEELSEDPTVIAITCLFLALKNEDTVKKLRDIQHTAHKLRDSNEEMDQRQLDLQRKQIMAIEFKLLQVLKFDLLNGNGMSALHLDQLVVNFANKLQLDYVHTFYAWLVAFDIILTPLPLMVPPHAIAVAILIVTLNIKPEGLLHKYHIDVKVNNLASILDNFDCYEVFRAPEPLVNEAILYILDYYVHNINYLVLNNYMPPVDAETGKEEVFKFMELKLRFNDLRIVLQALCNDKEWLRQDAYLQPWDYTAGQKGGVRFMLGTKRPRFEEELLVVREEKRQRRQRAKKKSHGNNSNSSNSNNANTPTGPTGQSGQNKQIAPIA